MNQIEIKYIQKQSVEASVLFITLANLVLFLDLLSHPPLLLALLMASYLPRSSHKSSAISLSPLHVKRTILSLDSASSIALSFLSLDSVSTLHYISTSAPIQPL